MPSQLEQPLQRYRQESKTDKEIEGTHPENRVNASRTRDTGRRYLFSYCFIYFSGRRYIFLDPYLLLERRRVYDPLHEVVSWNLTCCKNFAINP